MGSKYLLVVTNPAKSWQFMHLGTPQPEITCSQVTIETVEQDVKYVQSQQ